MKVLSLLQYELVLFILTTKNFYMIEFLLIGPLAPGPTVLIDIIIMEVLGTIMLVVKEGIMIHSGIRVHRLAVMWWMSC